MSGYRKVSESEKKKKSNCMFHSTMLKASGNVYIWYEIRKSVVGALNVDEINPAPLFG